ncbi:MAG: 2Fe-2S iron-sulfur cluster binding domain-containing protein [Lachnospiraceae bacterium]|jgi:NADP-reducing hydrogenase subunit HndD|nr:2Fe-2S iron-sulfur cluster binding domain-containing protein [Lachnospiraceae bacterium]
MGLINIKIEGISYQVEEGQTILEAAKKCGYEIPSLCTFNHGECNQGSCRVCLVEATGARGLVASCVYPISDGMEITISSPKAVEARRNSVELLLSDHNQNCQQCDKNGKCELLRVASITGSRELKFSGSHSETHLDTLAPGLVRDTSKCILCGRCIARCENAQGIGILGFENRGFDTFVSPAGDRSFADSPCIQCGQCVNVCPTGALMEHSEIDLVDEAFKKGKTVIVQAAPAVRAALGEEFDYPIGTPVTGKMIAALRRLGFYRVYDVNFGADLTIMEEGTELLNRITNNGVLPMITSCSPGWINYAEYNYGDLLPHLSSCKSPHQMQGAIIKSYWAKQNNIDPKDIFVVSVMPCIAKKFEKQRYQLRVNDIPDVDAVITTRELARMIKRAGIVFDKLPDEEWDADIMGDYSGAGVIFGVTGGVMEAALRTVYYKLTGKEKDEITFTEVRGHEAGIREASIDVNGTTINVAMASGMRSAKILLDDIKAGKSKYHFIEIMGCPGGCINGGGQPYVRSCFLPNEDDNIMDTYKEKRAQALYKEDEGRPIRQSHNNPQIKELYDKFLEEPNSHKAHELLHTTYKAREGFNEIEQ